jgi:hypothetical protein
MPTGKVIQEGLGEERRLKNSGRHTEGADIISFDGYSQDATISRFRNAPVYQTQTAIFQGPTLKWRTS